MSKKMIFKSEKGKIVFDTWEKNDEFGGYWVDICPDCEKKYQHLLEGRLDDSGSGVARCSVCGCINANAGCYADFKEDEVTFQDDEPIYKVLIRNAEEQEEFCKKLSKYSFCWLSGSPADQIPVFIKLKEDSLSQILTINTRKKTVGLFPTEVYLSDKPALEELLASCLSANQMLALITPQEKDETEMTSNEENPEVIGFIIQHGQDDYSYWNGFSLTDKEKKQIQEIISRHDTEGYSIRGAKKEILKDMSSQDDPVKTADIEEKIRKCLDQIHAETDILPKNFGDNILQD